MKEKELVEYIARLLVDNPDMVSVKETHGANVTVLELHVDRDDMGRVIGKDGRVANASAHTAACRVARSTCGAGDRLRTSL